MIAATDAPGAFATVFHCAKCGDRLAALSDTACAACPRCVAPPPHLTADAVESFLRGLPRGDLTDREFTLIAGNVRHFAAKARESLGHAYQQ